METKTEKIIIAENVISEKGNYIWKVSVAGSRSKKNVIYCVRALKAIRACYLLQARTGAKISHTCMQRLKSYHIPVSEILPEAEENKQD